MKPGRPNVLPLTVGAWQADRLEIDTMADFECAAALFEDGSITQFVDTAAAPKPS